MCCVCCLKTFTIFRLLLILCFRVICLKQQPELLRVLKVNANVIRLLFIDFPVSVHLTFCLAFCALTIKCLSRKIDYSSQ